MFEDKELLNIILYEKRFVTYTLCIIAIIIGTLLGFVKVPDEAVLKEYNSNYKNIVYYSDTENIKKIKIEKKDNYYFATNTSSTKIIGIYTDKNNYQKADFQKGKTIKITVPCNGSVSGVAIEE